MIGSTSTISKTMIPEVTAFRFLYLAELINRQQNDNNNLICNTNATFHNSGLYLKFLSISVHYTPHKNSIASFYYITIDRLGNYDAKETNEPRWAKIEVGGFSTL
jgi:hypothetical protein